MWFEREIATLSIKGNRTVESCRKLREVADKHPNNIIVSDKTIWKTLQKPARSKGGK